MSNQLDFFDMLGKDYENFKLQESNDWRWSLKDGYPTHTNGLKVFSCFACGGGSTMGYKLAGFDVLGCNEIDPDMNAIYVLNHHPKLNYLEDIRDFNKRDDLPSELFDLDILDGSPPCSTFSMAGQREDAWGVEKVFREGQKMQTLDDLSFIFIDTVKKLRPKVVVMENVEGLMKGNAWKYVQQIYTKFHEIGYKVKHWLLKGENMGIPQKRHRVFFIATRLDFDLNKIDMAFNYKPVTYGEIKEGKLKPLGKDTHFYYIASQARDDEHDIAETRVRLGEKRSAFQTKYIRDDEVMPTQRSKPDIIDLKEMAYVSKETVRNSQTFPRDFDFSPNTYSNIGYICGMSVPPIMMKRVATRLLESGIFESEGKCGDKQNI